MNHSTDAPLSTPEERRTALGRALRRARGKRTQREIGLAVGVPQSCISAWEAGKVDLSFERLRLLEQALGLFAGELAVYGGYCTARAFYPPTEHHDRFLAIGADFPERVAEWLKHHRALLEAAAQLRQLKDGHQAVETLLQVSPLVRLRLAWEFWERVVRAEGDAPIMHISQALPLEMIATLETALWDAPPFGSATSSIQ